MSWTTLTFGKHAGRTLPEIILADADWFFWAVNNDVFKGKLAAEANDLHRKARSIKIPKRRPSRWQVEYTFEDNGGFVRLRFVKANQPSYCTSPFVRCAPHLDFACVRRGRSYDKKGCRNLLRDFRRCYFGERRPLTKRRVEAFFSEGSNFVSAED